MSDDMTDAEIVEFVDLLVADNKAQASRIAELEKELNALKAWLPESMLNDFRADNPAFAIREPQRPGIEEKADE